MIPSESSVRSSVSVHLFVPESHVPIHWQSPPVASSVMVYGASFLVTVTVKVSSVTFPSAFVAVQVTVVTPLGNSEPDSGVHVGPLVMPYVSEAIGA